LVELRKHVPLERDATYPLPASWERWLVLAGAALVQLALGAVYTWSVFGSALGPGSPSTMHLDAAQASAPFSACLGTIFIGAFFGGRLQDRYGPRLVVLTGGLIYVTGVYLASGAGRPDQFWELVFGYGLVGGFGIGMAYVCPMAMLQRWFPRNRALATAIAVTGFGLGGVLTALVAAPLVAANPTVPTAALKPLAAIYLVLVLLGGALFRNPPAAAPSGIGGADVGRDDRSFTLGQALRTWQWTVLTATLAVNVAASVAFIGAAAAAARSMIGLSAHSAALLISVIAIANGLGRVFWAAISEGLEARARRTGRGAGRVDVFLIMLMLLGYSLVLLQLVHSTVVFFLVAAVVGLCCGGGFGAMPAMCADYFGLRHGGQIYGLMLVGWSAGGLLGPWALSSGLQPPDGPHYAAAFTWIGVLAGSFALVTALCRPPRRPRPPTPTAEPQRGESFDSPTPSSSDRNPGPPHPLTQPA
jgi:OFA family oxalate/formate antiporter-like MFS transporter